MNIQALILTSIAGLATLLGFGTIYLKKDKDIIISSSLGLAIGVMILVSLSDLLPNALIYFKLSFYSIFSYIFWVLFFIIGILLSITCNDFINNKNDNLCRVGIISLITLILHNIPEGIITYLTTNLEYKTGIMLTVAIALHNIPEGISIAVPIYYATNNKIKAFIAIFLASLSEPLGAVIAYLFIEESLSNMLIGMLYAMVAGIMVAISLTELLPEAKNYSIRYTYFFIVLGFITIIVSHLLL